MNQQARISSKVIKMPQQQLNSNIQLLAELREVDRHAINLLRLRGLIPASDRRVARSEFQGVKAA
jgi:hypothetical protein